jgi:tetratricopeptide (TPR) repeat protein
MRQAPTLATLLALAIIGLTPSSANADDMTASWWAPRMRLRDTAATEPPNKAPDAAPAPAPPASTATAAPAAAPAPAPAAILPDAALLHTIELVRRSPIGNEPNAVAYLDLMAAGSASAAQVNDFAAYVAKRGMPNVALTFQNYAVSLDPGNAILWQNLGTIQRTNGALGPAATAFKKAVALDPINALAHYNLGAVYDAQGSYDDAIEEYRKALVLDPGLADPRKNPQVVNNENLLAVKLEIYGDQAGSLGLPLLQIQKTAPPKKAAPDKP